MNNTTAKETTHEQVLELWDAAISGTVSAQFPAGPRISLIQFERFLDSIDGMGLQIADADCLDFGCGPIRPYGMAVLLYLFGAKSVISLDISPYQNEKAIAVGIYVLLLMFLVGATGLERFRLFNRRAIESKVADFTLEALRQGDLRQGLPKQIRHVVGDYRAVHGQIGSFDVLVSNSVFEHVHDLPVVLSLLRQRLRQTGYMYVDIDYRDHRLYTKRLSPWQYLIDGDDVSPGYINKLRHSEMFEIIFAAGFSIVHQLQISNEPPPGLIASLRRNGYAGKESDLRILVDRLVLRQALSV